MRVAVVLEQRFDRTPDGRVWATGTSYEFWQRYLDVFSEVVVVARVRDASTPAPNTTVSSGPGVTFAGVPHYLGPTQYLRVARGLARAVRGALAPDDAVILRIGSQIAIALAPHLWRTGRPYGVEVVGDPEDVFAPGVVGHPLRPFLRVWFTFFQRKLCARACGAAYVTAWTLQKKYPCGAMSIGISDVHIDTSQVTPQPTVLMTHYSSAALQRSDFLARVPGMEPSSNGFRIVTIASLAQLYKGIDVLIRAVSLCKEFSPPIRLVVIGDGRYRTTLERLARRLGVAERVLFLGTVSPGAGIREELDRSDLFVLPSRTEGLPRALVEAMARGLPCIGSAVGGIPELLPAEDLIAARDPHTLAAKIVEVASDATRRIAMSRRNFEKAQEYQESVLRARRMKFYRHVERVTAEWQGGTRSPDEFVAPKTAN